MKKLRGDTIVTSRRRASELARQKNEEQRTRAAARRAREAEEERQQHYDRIDQEVLRLEAERQKIRTRTADVRRARVQAAQRTNGRVAAFLKKRRSEFNAVEVHGARALDGPNPLPLATPYAYKASDLFKTFRDDEVW